MFPPTIINFSIIFRILIKSYINSELSLPLNVPSVTNMLKPLYLFYKCVWAEIIGNQLRLYLAEKHLRGPSLVLSTFMIKNRFYLINYF